MKKGDKVTGESQRPVFAKDMFYTGTFEGYTKGGLVRIKGNRGIRCFAKQNVS